MNASELPDWAEASREEDEARTKRDLLDQLQELTAGQQQLQRAILDLTRSQLSILQSLDRKQDRVIAAADRIATIGETTYDSLAERASTLIWQRLAPTITATDKSGRDLLDALGPASRIVRELEELRHLERQNAELREGEWWKPLVARSIAGAMILLFAGIVVLYLLANVLPVSVVCRSLGGQYERVVKDRLLPEDQVTYRTFCSIGEIN